MKILMPYISRSGHNINSPVVSGGIEKFGKNLFEMFPDSIIPVEITKEDRDAKKSKEVYFAAIERHQPDLILINDIDAYFFAPQIDKGIPTISIIHEPLLRDIRYLQMFDTLHKFNDAGGHIYFVSALQYEHFDKNTKRVTGKSLGSIKGYINSSFCSGSETASETKLYDALTIGRTDTSKNPFFLHKKLCDTDLVTCVITNKDNFQSSKEQIKYFDSNLHWQDPQHTMRGLTHVDTMDILSKSKCFVSTFPSESWGITTLEALSHGVPVILVTDNTGNHASECIPASADHYRKVHKSVSPEELAKIVKEFSELTFEQRLQISDMTKEKHNKILYKAYLDQMFCDRMQTTQQQTGLELFL